MGVGRGCSLVVMIFIIPSMHFNPLPLVIRKIRDQHELTQTQLADRMGVKQGTISSWENGKTRPNLQAEQNLFKHLGTTDAEIGEALYEIISGRFGYGRGEVRPQAPAPRPLARVEKMLEEMADSLTPEDVEEYEKDIETARQFEAAYKQSVWRLEDRLSKAAGKGGI